MFAKCESVKKHTRLSLLLQYNRINLTNSSFIQSKTV